MTALAKATEAASRALRPHAIVPTEAVQRAVQEAVRELLKDMSWDAIEAKAMHLFKHSERERGAIRPQVVTSQDSLDYWTMVATIAEIRRRAGIGESGQ